MNIVASIELNTVINSLKQTILKHFSSPIDYEGLGST